MAAGGTKFSAICSVLEFPDALNYVHAMMTAEKITKFSQFRVPAERWFLFSSREQANLPLYKTESQMEHFVNYVGAKMPSRKIAHLENGYLDTIDDLFQVAPVLKSLPLTSEPKSCIILGPDDLVSKGLIRICQDLAYNLSIASAPAPASRKISAFNFPQLFTRKKSITAATEMCKILKQELSKEVMELHNKNDSQNSHENTISAIAAILERCYTLHPNVKDFLGCLPGIWTDLGFKMTQITQKIESERKMEKALTAGFCETTDSNEWLAIDDNRSRTDSGNFSDSPGLRGSPMVLPKVDNCKAGCHLREPCLYQMTN